MEESWDTACGEERRTLDVSEQEALEHAQAELAHSLSFTPLDISSVRLVAGADTAYWDDGDAERGACCIVVVDVDTSEVVEVATSHGEVAVEYVPGLLAYRELPLFEEAYAKLESDPDVIMFDGNGYLHPRHMGIASHASLVTGKPCLGVAKTFYNYGRTGFAMPEDQVGACTDIVIDGETCGRALRTHRGSKPVFVSAGGNIDLEASCALTLRLRSPESRVPIPTRLADLETHRLRAQLRVE